LLGLTLFGILLNVNIVLGANVLETALGAIGNLDLGDTYLKFPYLIDGAIYIALFISICKSIFKKVPAFQDSTAVPVILGIMLAVSMAVIEHQTGFLVLRDIGPIALLIFGMVLGVMVYKNLKDFNWNTVLAIAVALLIVYGLIFKVVKTLIGTSTSGPTSQALAGIDPFMGLAILLMMPIGLYQQFKGMGTTSGPSNSERRDVSDTFPRQEEAKRKIAALESALESESKKNKDKTQTDTIEEEEDTEKFDEYINVLDAEAIKFAQQLEKSKSKELDMEAKEAIMLDAISSYADNIDKVLAQMKTSQVIDEAGKQYMIKNIEGIAQVCIQIAENQKELNTDRKDTATKLNEDIIKIDDSISKFSAINNDLQNIEKRIPGHIGSELLKKAESKIEVQKTKLKTLQAQLKSKKTSTANIPIISGEIDQLNTETNNSEKELDALKNTGNIVKSYVSELDNMIKEIRNILLDVNTARKTIDNQDQKTIKFVKSFDVLVAKMDLATKSLTVDMNKLHATSTLTEEVPIKATIHVSEIFNQLIELHLNIKKFYEQELLPFVNDLKIVVGNSSRLEDPIRNIKSSTFKIENAYLQLKDSVEKMIGKDVGKSNLSTKIKEVSTYTENLLRNERNARDIVNSQTIKTIDKIIKDTTNEIQNITVELQKLQSTEKKVLNKLSQALELVVKHKTRANAEFGKEAAQFTTQMSEATQKIHESRKNIV
jgi:hypothetical protein